MDLSDQRMACLRLAMDLNCNTDELLKAADKLMDFVAHGSTPAIHPETNVAVATAAAEPSADAIAACGTALLMPEIGGLALAEPAGGAAPAADPQAAAESVTEGTNEVTDEGTIDGGAGEAVHAASTSDVETSKTAKPDEQASEANDAEPAAAASSELGEHQEEAAASGASVEESPSEGIAEDSQSGREPEPDLTAAAVEPVVIAEIESDEPKTAELATSADDAEHAADAPDPALAVVPDVVQSSATHQEDAVAVN